MSMATFYPTSYGLLGSMLTYEATMRAIERREPDLRTTQMCMLDKVKDYDVIRIVSQHDVIEIVNNDHDGTYSCDRTSRTLRRANNFYKLWENGEFDEMGGSVSNPSKEVMRRSVEGHLTDLERMREFDRGYRAGRQAMDAERYKAVCALRKIHTDAGGFVKALAKALDVEWQAPRVHQTLALVRDRLIYLLGGDEPNFTEIAETINLGNESEGELMENCENHKIATITDELREWASTEVPYKYGRQLHAIATRIEEQFARICQQQEAVLQSTIERMVDENLMVKDERDHLRRQRDELQAKLDEIAEVLDGGD